MAYIQKDILNYLDGFDHAIYYFFIDLEHPYFHTAGSRITLYADATRWAIVFEKSGYDNAAFNGQIDLSYFGNCLLNLQSEGSPERYTSNSKSVVLIDGDEIQRIENDMDSLVSPDVHQVKVRERWVTIEHNKQVYVDKNISDPGFPIDEQLIDMPSLIRYLDEHYPKLFRATENELLQCLPGDVPKIMQIDKWHHEAYYQGSGIKPSTQESYKLIADVLVTKEIKKWHPLQEPNNDWRNWENAGYM